jgi:hypothetical protein
MFNFKSTKMGWSILVYGVSGLYMEHDSLQLSNLTSNYCTQECMKYWHGPRDFDNKTVGEAIYIMRKAIIAMFSDGVLPLKWCDKQNKDNTLRSLLFWLISTSIELSKFSKDWTVKLE